MRWFFLTLILLLPACKAPEPEPEPPPGTSRGVRQKITVGHTERDAAGPAESLRVVVPGLGEFGPMPKGQGAHTLEATYDATHEEVKLTFESPSFDAEVDGPVVFHFTIAGQPFERSVALSPPAR